MKNKILGIAIVLPLLSVTSLVSADFDCSTLDRETVMEVVEKDKNGETLTTSEETILENAETCRPEGAGTGNQGERPEGMTEEDREEMQEIIEKVDNGETLTDDEQEKYDAFEANKGNGDVNKGTGTMNKAGSTNMTEKSKKTTNIQSTSTVTSATKIKLNVVIKKIDKIISGYSDAKKISTLETLQTKITSIRSTISTTSSYTDTKKETFYSMFDYLSEQIDNRIDEIESGDSEDDILDELFN